MSRVSTPVQQLTRWQIPLHLTSQPDDPAGMVIVPLKLGNEWTPELTLKAPAPQPTQPVPPPPPYWRWKPNLIIRAPSIPVSRDLSAHALAPHHHAAARAQ